MIRFDIIYGLSKVPLPFDDTDANSVSLEIVIGLFGELLVIEANLLFRGILFPDTWLIGPGSVENAIMQERTITNTKINFLVYNPSTSIQISKKMYL